jgi:lipoyl(octanoyl) transferase
MNRGTVLVHRSLRNGTIDYVKGWALQHLFLEQRLAIRRCNNKELKESDIIYNTFDTDRILMFQHKCVYTLGRGADENNLIFLDAESDGGIRSRQMLSRKARAPNSCRLSTDVLKGIDLKNASVHDIINLLHKFSHETKVFCPNGIPIYRVERGGEVTYHGPGQLVCYPLFDLQQNPFKQDLHWYLRNIEEVIIKVLREYGIQGTRDEINTGVWVGHNKIAAIGISSARWITTHGFALNIHPQLEKFDTSLIIPCGIEGRGVTSIENEMQGEIPPSFEEVTDLVLNKMQEVFDISIEVGEDL